jgi:hypothetical protein
MEIEGAGERAGPYVAAVDLNAAAEPQPERINSKPAAAHVMWIRSIGEYVRRETSELQAARYG